MLREKLKDYKIILASGSPRRQQFFKELDLDFEIRVKEVEEIYPDTLQGVEITNYLAKLKSAAFDNTIQPNEIIVTSDTIVWLENKALGKPKDKQDAFLMLQSMAGKTHEVITSVCFKTVNKIDILNCVTRVTFNPISDAEILFYIDNYQPFDKAGAYGIQEWIGLMAIAKIEGSYTNVVGLPTDLVYRYLSNLK
ncbi:Maf-like protein [Flavobacterium macrobrachii]|uniref:dTTP/UTP pyrophosphatase n=1 Tax=Flavobacterium macrobrachii TaxID=591204 RepID=A0ABS2CX98_9FLAO|nr:Maf-like protein [Flavobacterium macrobrachii]MBM6499588.1 septum formation protein Maf [Flavobacterium macrobrachii]